MSTTIEKHYSPKELSEWWNFGIDTIRKLIKNEPGVLKLSGLGGSGKRSYATYSVPESVAVRIYNRMRATPQEPALPRKKNPKTVVLLRNRVA